MIKRSFSILQSNIVEVQVGLSRNIVDLMSINASIGQSSRSGVCQLIEKRLMWHMHITLNQFSTAQGRWQHQYKVHLGQGLFFTLNPGGRFVGRTQPALLLLINQCTRCSPIPDGCYVQLTIYTGG